MENGNCPTITLRKGKTELKILNAAAVVKRINEMYPDNDWYSWAKNKGAEQVNRQRRWTQAAKDWFKQEMFGGTEDFEVIINGPEDRPIELKPVETKLVETKQTPPFPHTAMYADPYVYQPPVSLPVTPPEPQLVQSVNKNAYEIRLDVLKEAIMWAGRSGTSTNDDVLDLAKKFYAFVEDRRR